MIIINRHTLQLDPLDFVWFISVMYVSQIVSYLSVTSSVLDIYNILQISEKPAFNYDYAINI